jgi:hypothetical protein
MAEALMMQRLHGPSQNEELVGGPLAFPSVAAPELQARVARFCEEIARWVAATEGERDCVCQLSMHIFPGLAGTLERGSKC